MRLRTSVNTCCSW